MNSENKSANVKYPKDTNDIVVVISKLECTILCTPLRDPVVIDNGETYEKEGIEELIKFMKHSGVLKSPTTRQPVRGSQLIRNKKICSLNKKIMNGSTFTAATPPEEILCKESGKVMRWCFITKEGTTKQRPHISQHAVRGFLSSYYQMCSIL